MNLKKRKLYRNFYCQNDHNNYNWLKNVLLPFTTFTML